MQLIKTADVIAQLNAFLRGEISAVETYQIARDRVSVLGPQGEIDQCLRSHQERVHSLRSRVIALGGEPTTSSGAWGTLAKTLEAGAAVLGDAAALAVLEEGEDHGVRAYRDYLDKNPPASCTVDDATRAYFGDLLRKQLKTHAIMSGLKRMMHEAGHASAP